MKKVKRYLSICIAIAFMFYAIPLNISFMGKRFSNVKVVKAASMPIYAMEDISVDTNYQWGHGQLGSSGLENYVGSNLSNALTYERLAIKFDLNSIPAAADISSVNLKLYVDDVIPTTPGYPVVNIAKMQL